MRNEKLTAETTQLVDNYVSKFEASEFPGLADSLENFVASEYELRRTTMMNNMNWGKEWREELWAEYQDAIRQYARQLAA